MRKEKLVGVVVGAFAAVLAARSLVTRLFDADLWWLMAHGREMMATRRLLSTDIFTHTLAGAPMVNFEWLAEIIFFLMWKAAWPAGLILFKLAGGMAVGALLVVLARRHGARGPWLALLAWAAFWAIRPRLNERAELFTLVAIPLTLWLLELGWRHARLRVPSLVALTLGMIALANMHGGWIFVPALLFLRTIGGAWAKEDGQRVRYFALATVLSAAAGLVNPYGIHVIGVQLTHVARLGGGLSNRDLIEEWKPTTVADAPFFWLLYVLAMGALLFGLRRRERWAYAWAPAVLVFGIWGAQAYRNAALFVFAAVPLLAGAAALLTEKTGWRWAAWAVMAALVAAKTPVLHWPWPTTPVQWRFFPERACAFVSQNDIDGRMFNSLGQGGYISWTLGPGRKVFADGRYICFPLVRDLVEASHRGDFSRFLADRGVDYAIVDHDAPARFATDAATRSDGLRALFPRQEWAMVFWDDAAAVFLKRVPKFAAVIAAKEFHLLTPGDVPAMAAMSESDRVRALAELERHSAEVGFSVLAAELAAGLGATPAEGSTEKR